MTCLIDRGVALDASGIGVDQQGLQSSPVIPAHARKACLKPLG